jgi:hypothetical protein
MVGAWKPNETEGKQPSTHQGVQRLITEVTSVVRRYANPSSKPFQNKPLRHFGIRRNGKHGMDIIRSDLSNVNKIYTTILNSLFFL